MIRENTLEGSALHNAVCLALCSRRQRPHIAFQQLLSALAKRLPRRIQHALFCPGTGSTFTDSIAVLQAHTHEEQAAVVVGARAVIVKSWFEASADRSSVPWRPSS